jgi:hypothetical protein
VGLRRCASSSLANESVEGLRDKDSEVDRADRWLSREPLRDGRGELLELRMLEALEELERD